MPLFSLRTTCLAAVPFVALLALPADTLAQEREPRRIRVALGPELSPSYPGSSKVSFGPFIGVDLARGTEPFEFEAPDEGFGFAVLHLGRVEIGPSIQLEGKRKASDVAPGLPEVDLSVELGGFVQYFVAEAFRVRADVRQGVTGHKALVGELSADWVNRDGDKWLLSAGPRLTLGSARYQRTYFGVSPSESVASGLPAYKADAGVQAVGVAAGFIRQLDDRWSLHGYTRYDRLIGDAGNSPVVRERGSRNQFSGGIALGYSFWWGKR